MKRAGRSHNDTILKRLKGAGVFEARLSEDKNYIIFKEMANETFWVAVGYDDMAILIEELAELYSEMVPYDPDFYTTPEGYGA